MTGGQIEVVIQERIITTGNLPGAKKLVVVL